MKWNMDISGRRKPRRAGASGDGVLNQDDLCVVSTKYNGKGDLKPGDLGTHPVQSFTHGRCSINQRFHGSTAPIDCPLRREFFYHESRHIAYR